MSVDMKWGCEASKYGYIFSCNPTDSPHYRHIFLIEPITEYKDIVSSLNYESPPSKEFMKQSKVSGKVCKAQQKHKHPVILKNIADFNQDFGLWIMYIWKKDTHTHTHPLSVSLVLSHTRDSDLTFLNSLFIGS